MVSRSKYEIYHDASLSQKLGYKDPIYSELAGSDPDTSKKIAFLHVLHDQGLINKDQEPWKFILALLNALRKSQFATSDKVNEITKMGFQMPKKDNVFGD